MQTEGEKLQLKQEVSKVLDRVQKEVLAATQKHFDREMELQDLCKQERASHMKTIEVFLVSLLSQAWGLAYKWMHCS